MYFVKVKVKVSVSSPDILVTTHVLQIFPPLAVGTQQPARIDPTLDLCTRYPLQLGGLAQCEIGSLPTLLNTVNTGNRSPDLLILNPMPYPLGHMLPKFCGKFCHLQQQHNVLTHIQQQQWHIPYTSRLTQRATLVILYIPYTGFPHFSVHKFKQDSSICQGSWADI